MKVPFKGINGIDYAGNFEDFLAQVPDDKPFCFWLGAKEPHRGYELDSWKKDGRDLSQVTVPKFFRTTTPFVAISPTMQSKSNGMTSTLGVVWTI